MDLNEVRGGEAKKESLPRYVRVNTLKIDVKAAVKALEQSGYKFVKSPRLRSSGKERWRKPKVSQQNDRRSFRLDEHIPNLLMFKPGSNMGKHPMVLSGELIIQDKASCFTAQVLSPPPGSTVIDSCAAPGSKTTHLAALLQGRGAVFAFDRDAARIEKLKFVLNRTGASSIVKPAHLNFLKAPTNAKVFQNVTHVLVDPSCSGSGMNLTWSLKPAAADAKEVAALADNQLKCILHAMAFPKVQAVAYSTCSVYDEENELVVQKALAANPRFELAPCLPKWPTRGKPLFPGGDLCVRTCKADQTIGFFVALFVLKGSASAAQAHALAAARSRTDSKASVVGATGGAGAAAGSDESAADAAEASEDDGDDDAEAEAAPSDGAERTGGFQTAPAQESKAAGSSTLATGPNRKRKRSELVQSAPASSAAAAGAKVASAAVKARRNARKKRKLESIKAARKEEAVPKSS